MGCPTDVIIGENLVFSVRTHDPDGGALTDADNDPSYRIYRDDTGSLAANGTMSKLDDANTTGLYAESCATDDFVDGKSYTLSIDATVDSITGGITFGFMAHEKVDIAIGVPIKIQGFDAVGGKQVHIVGRYL